MEQTTQSPVKKDYGPLESVPAESRHIGFWDSIATWAGATLQPNTWTLGGTVICIGALSGIVCSIVTGLLAYGVIGLFSFMCYLTGTSSSGMSRFTLGIRGSKFFSLAGLINSCGWSVLSNYMAAITYSYIFQLYFHTPAYGEPGCEAVMVIGCLLNAVMSYLAVGIGGSRLMKIFENIMMIALGIFSIVLFYVLLKNLSISEIFSFRVPEENRMKLFGAFDFLLAISIPFCVVGGDLGRNMKTAKAARFSPIAGGVTAQLVFILMGMCGVILNYKNTGVFDAEAANPSTLAMRTGLGVVALLVVLFATVTTNMVDVFAMTNNVMNLAPKLSFKRSAFLAGVLPMLFCWLPVFIKTFFGVFYSFTDILGALFPPVIAIILVDFFLIRKRQVHMEDIDRPNGRYWYSGGFNLYAIIVWLAGSILYFLLHVVYAISFFSNVIISMVIVAAVYYLAAKLAVKKGYYQV